MTWRMQSNKIVILLVVLLALTFLIKAVAPAHSVKALKNSDLRLEGVLVYHRYSDYGAWNGQLWMIELSTGRIAHINRDWKGMISPINAHFSADGESMVFMGSAAGLLENDWDVFVSHWNGKNWAEPINLTGPNGKRDEDPKFSLDGSKIVYKEDGVLTTMLADGRDKTYLTPGERESSIPYFLPNGRDIIFERHDKIMIYKNGKVSELWNDPVLRAYYPIGVDEKKYLYTQVQANHHDRLMWGYYDGSESKPLSFNSTQWDTSDPFPYKDGSRYIFYVSGDFSVHEGGYNLMIADIVRNRVASMGIINAQANSDLEELGPAWSAKGKFPIQ